MQNSIAEINEMNKNVKNSKTGGRLSPITKKNDFILPGFRSNQRSSGAYSSAAVTRNDAKKVLPSSLNKNAV